jgi:formiminotetrahydrofolate cyclodeaminase
VTVERPEKNKPVVIMNGWMNVSVNLGDITDEKIDAITNAANE